MATHQNAPPGLHTVTDRRPAKASASSRVQLSGYWNEIPSLSNLAGTKAREYGLIGSLGQRSSYPTRRNRETGATPQTGVVAIGRFCYLAHVRVVQKP